MSSGCGDVLSLEDLKTAKKHQTFEAEVITGLTGGVPGGAEIDYATNPVTGQIQKTMPAILRDLGFIPASFDFASGGTLGINDRDKVVLWPISAGGDGNYYSWRGALPKTIPAASTPASTGGVSASAWQPVTDGSLRNEVFALNGGVRRSFQNVAQMKAFAVQAGYSYSTAGFYTAGDGGGAIYVANNTGSTPDGFGDHVASNGIFLRLMGEATDLNHGVIIGATYDATRCWNNRNALQYGTRNTRFSKFTCKAQGIVASVGAVNIARDNYEFVIEKGCTLQNYYNEPTIPASNTSQGGGFLAFGHFFNPDIGDFIPFANGDTRVNAPVYNVKVRLDGEVSTMYRAVHANPYNNNAIAFLKAVNCEVIGSGGIGESDHRGINFDGISTNAPGGSENRGGAINCRMKVGYINGCVDNPAMMAGDIFTRNTCSIKIGSVGAMRTGGYNNPIVVNVSGTATYHSVSIGDFIRGSGVTPGFVVARSCAGVKVRAGTVNGCSSILFMDACIENDVEVKEIFNTPTGIYRSGTTGGQLRTVRLANIKTTDSQFLTAYNDANQASGFLSLIIENNSFASVGSGFSYFRGRITSNQPTIEDIRNNIPPATGDGGGSLNMYPSKSALAPEVTDGLATATVNFKNLNWNYTKLTVCVRNGSARGMVTIDLRARTITSNDISVNAGIYPVNTQMTAGGGTITLTPTAPTVLSYAVLHN